jgi:VIT1/CCC1 family predicted Fe2+/Mn2+ transporter
MRSLFHSDRKHRIPFGTERFLAIFEGFEGGFAIGAGIIAGMSVVNVDRNVLIATAVVSIIVNGFNSASVKYSSEHYLDELDGYEVPRKFVRYFVPAFTQFVAYFVISFVSIIPLFIMGNIPDAITYSIVTTIVILLIAGYYRAYVLDMPRWRDALEIALLGSGIIMVGYVSGFVIHRLLGA